MIGGVGSVWKIISYTLMLWKYIELIGGVTLSNGSSLWWKILEGLFSILCLKQKANYLCIILKIIAR